MTTLFDTTRPVKTTRRRRFAAGLLSPDRPSERSAADRASRAAESARMEAERVARWYDRQAAESAALDALTRGLIPPDLARDLMAAGIIGHDP